MKKLLSLAFIAILLVSCESRSERLQDLQTSPNVRAKVECISTPVTSEIKRGDVVIRFIDSMYNIGDQVRLTGYVFKVLAIQKPQPIVSPEIIVSPSGQVYQNVPISLKDYQLEVIEDTILVWDMNRLVGKTSWEDHDKGIGEIIAADNQ